MRWAQSNQTELRVLTAEADQEIGNCFEAMHALRTNLRSRESFISQVQRQQRDFGYILLAALSSEGPVVGVAGFRPQENLMHGLHVYVDDLVTVEAWRNRGVGATLMNVVIERAYASGYKKILLDTGRQSEEAHRFYARLGFSAKALRFSLELDDRLSRALQGSKRSAQPA